MEETDVEILHSPGSLSNSEIGIILKSQQDFQDLLKQIQQKDKRIEKLKFQLEQPDEVPALDRLFISGLVGLVWGVLVSFVIAFALVGHSSYESGVSDGLKYKKQFCQLKHPKSASAYQACMES